MAIARRATTVSDSNVEETAALSSTAEPGRQAVYDRRMAWRPERPSTLLLGLATCFALLGFLTLTFKHISYPLLWHDESDTVMFAKRVLEFGYPKVHDGKNVVYGLPPHRLPDGRLALRSSAKLDAYTGAPWAYYYFGAIGVALAADADDLYAKTAWLRLPFATLGVLGLGVLLWGVLEAMGGSVRSRLAFASAYWALAAYSVSLILHLREARYYGLIVFLSCALLVVFLRYHVLGRLSTTRYWVLVTGLLFLIFNTFYPVYAVFVAALGLNLAGSALRSSRPGRERLRELLRGALPLLASLVLTLPLLAFFDFLGQTQGWIEGWGASLGSYAANLHSVGLILARYEFLVPALAMRLVVVLGSDRADDAAAGLRRRIAGFLLLFCACYVLLVSIAPFIWERYFIALSPAITTLLLLDTWTFAGRLRAAPRLRGSAAAGILVAACFAVNVGLRVPELRGRLYEITHRYEGPLDYIVPYLRERHPDPSRLVIATNYEDPVYMYYLGCRVTIGFYGANLAEDLGLQPDVIVFRPWDNQRRILEWLKSRARYEARVFPIRSSKANNVPGLSPRSAGRGMIHRFATEHADSGDRVRLFERVPETSSWNPSELPRQGGWQNPARRAPHAGDPESAPVKESP